MAKITHKIRNPKHLGKWLDIWTASVTSGTSYIITPSNKWQIPVSRIIQDNTIVNVTTTSSTGSTNHIAVFGSNSGELTNGPELTPGQSESNRFLRSDGSWIDITGYQYDLNVGTASSNSTNIYLRFKENSNNSGNFINKDSIKIQTTNPIKLSTDTSTQKVSLTLDKLTNSDIADNANITGSKIADNSITSDKLASDINIPVNNIALNSKTSRGVVEKGQGHANSFWGTGADSVPGWQSFDIEELDYSIRSKINTAWENGMVLKTNGDYNKVWGVEDRDSNSLSLLGYPQPGWHFVEAIDTTYSFIGYTFPVLAGMGDTATGHDGIGSAQGYSGSVLTELSNNDYCLDLQIVDAYCYFDEDVHAKIQPSEQYRTAKIT